MSGAASRSGSGGRCPVCGAGFRGTAQCSRCGADLTALMRLAAQAGRMRQAAVAGLAGGNLTEAAAMALRAGRLHVTPGGARLRRLAAWLASSSDAR